MRNKLFAPASFVPRVAAGDIGLYSAVTLLDVLFSPENAPELNQFWMKFFPRSINFTTGGPFRLNERSIKREGLGVKGKVS